MNVKQAIAIFTLFMTLVGCGHSGVLRSDLTFSPESYEAEDERISAALIQTPQAFDWRLRRAALDYAMGRYDSANRQLIDLASKEPDDPDLYVLHALVLQELEQFEEAVKSLDKARNLAPSLPLDPLLKSIVGAGLRAYEEAGNWRSANQLAEKGASYLKEPGHEQDLGLAAKAHLEWGKQVRSGGYYRDAITTLERCRGLTQDPECDYELGAAHAAIGNQEEALVAFQRYLGDEFTAEDLLRVGAFLEENFLFDEALTIYEKSNALPNMKKKLRDVVTELRLKRQEPEEAKAHAMAGLRGEEIPSAESWLSQAMLFQRYRESEIATTFIEQAMEAFPESLALVDAKARSLLFEGKSGDVERLFEEHLGMFPSRGGDIGRLIEDLGLVKEAREFYEQTAAKGNGNVVLWVDAARMAYEEGDWKGCNRVLERFIRESKGTSESRETVGLFFAKRSNERAAERYLSEAFRQSPGRANTAFGLARIYRDQGKKSAEAKTLKRFLGENSQAPQSILAVGDYWREAGESEKAEGLYERLLTDSTLDEEMAKKALSGLTQIYVESERLADLENLVEDRMEKGSLAVFTAEEAWSAIKDRPVEPLTRLRKLATLRRQASPNQVDVLLEYAGVMLKLELSEEASAAFIRVIGLSPNSQQVFATISKELHEQGETGVVLRLLEALPELILPPEVSRGVGLLLLEEGSQHDPEKGQQYLRAFLDSEALEPRACIDTGEMLRKQGYFDLAEYGLGRPACLELKEERFGSLGQLKLIQGKKKEALAYFQEELGASSDPGRSAERVAGLLLAGNHPRSSVEYFETALRTLDLNGWFRLVDPYSDAMGRYGDYAGLRDFLRRFIEKAEGVPRALEVAAGAFRKQGLIREATDEIKRLAEQRRGSARIEEALGIHAFSAGESTVGLEAFKRAARLWGGAPQHVARLGEVLEGQGMFQEALSLYDESKKVHEQHPLLEVRRAVVLLGQGEVMDARDALFSAIQTASEPEAILNFLSPHIRAAARIDLLRDGVDLALEKFPRKAGLLTMSVDTQLLLGDVEGAIVRSEAALALHPDQAGALGEIFESHQLDKMAFDLYLRALNLGDGKEKSDKKGRLFSGLMRTGEWTKGSQLKSLSEKYDGQFGHTSKTFGQFIQVASSLGEFGLALEASKRRVEGSPHLVGLLQTMLLGAQLENKALVSEFLDKALNLAKTAEDGALIVESLENLQLAGWSEEVTRAYEVMTTDKPTLIPWVGGSAVANALWSDGPEVAVTRLKTILAGPGFLPMEELTRLESWFRWAGQEQAFLKALQESLDSGFRARVAVVLIRNDWNSPKVEGMLASHVDPWDSPAQLMLAGALLDASKYDAANDILEKLLQRSGVKEWGSALRMRMRSAALRGDSLDWSQVNTWATQHNENLREAYGKARVIAREMQRWDLEDAALEQLLELTPTRTVLWLHKMEIALFQGDVKAYRGALSELLRNSSNGFEVRRELVDALEGQFEYQLALELLAELIATYPGDQSLVWRAGRLSLELGGVEDAERHFRAYESGHWSSRFAGYDVDKAYLDARRIRGESEPQEPISLDVEPADQGWLGKSGALLQVRRRILEGQNEAGLQEFREQSTLLQGRTSLLETGIHLREEHREVDSTLFVRALQGAVSSGVKPSLRTQAFIASELLRGEQGAEGAKLAREILQTGNRSRGVLNLLAKGALTAEDWKLAREIFRQTLDSPLDRKLAIVAVVEQINEHIQLKLALGEEIAVELGTLAFEYLDPLAKLHPAHVWYVTLGSDVAEAIGDSQGAETVFERTMAAYPRDSSSFNNLAYLFARRGTELERAQTLVEKAMLLEPKHNVYYLDTAGWIAFKRGKFELARDLLLASLRQMNRNQGQSVSESLWHLGRVYEEMGRRDSAIWCYQKALRIAPSGAFGVRSEQALERLGPSGSRRSLELE